jgi:hypothetical protein
MTTITWQIDSINISSQPVAGENKVVLTAQWRCIGVDGDWTTSTYGSCSFPEPTTGGQFTPYEQLSQSQVLEWCFANGVNKTDIEENVTKSVNNLSNPSTVNSTLPWIGQEV